jgi:hypothetical protein
MTAQPGTIITHGGQHHRLLTRLESGESKGRWWAVPVRAAGHDEKGTPIFEQIGIKMVEVEV